MTAVQRFRGVELVEKRMRREERIAALKEMNPTIVGKDDAWWGGVLDAIDLLHEVRGSDSGFRAGRRRRL